MSELLQESEITVDRIESLFKSAFIPCTRDADGDLRIEDEGVKTFVNVDADKKLVVMFSVWGLRQRVSMEKKLAWVNDLNQKLVLVKFQVVNPETLWCDYQLRYEGGLSPLQLVSTVRLFGKVCRGAASLNDPDNIIGRD